MNVNSEVHSQITFRAKRRISDWNLLQFHFQAQKFTAYTHHCGTDGIQTPPAKRRWESPIVEPANHQMCQMKRAGEIQTEFSASHDKSQNSCTGKSIQHKG